MCIRDSTTGPGRTNVFAYAANGFLASITDALGRTVSLTNNAVGRITNVTRPGGATVDLNYDTNGNVARITPPGQPSHLFAYTARDEASTYAAPVVGTENSQATLAYDADRMPTHVKRPHGETNSLQYDSAGRVSLAILPTGQRTYDYD